MEQNNQPQWSEVKKVKFHHRVKRFYYKNLFRKIYTVAIIGLIGANIFSLLKYQSNAALIIHEDEYNTCIGGRITCATGKIPENIVVTKGVAPDYVDTNGKHFTMGSLMITSGSESVIMMDRNLGATKSGTGCAYEIDATECPIDDPTYGYYFQWGNNYGFSYQNNEMNMSPVDTSSYSRENPYVNNVFVGLFGDESWEGLHENLRGGAGDTTTQWPNPDYMRQGPCPQGWHVPSYGELENLQNFVGEGSNKENVYNELFLLPAAGFIKSTNYVAKPNFFGDMFLIYSSSFKYYMNGGLFQHNTNFGNSIRCFKNRRESEYVNYTDSSFYTVIGEDRYPQFPESTEISVGNIVEVSGEGVLGEVSINLGTENRAVFTKPVQINIPVNDDQIENVKIKVKHNGSSEYSYDGLTTNVNATCDNGLINSGNDVYNGESIDVIGGFATIYTCAASSFVALSVPTTYYTLTFVDKYDITNILSTKDGIGAGATIVANMLPASIDYYTNVYYTAENELISDITSVTISEDTTILVDRVPNKIIVNYYPNGGTETTSLSEDVSADNDDWTVKTVGMEYDVNKTGYHSAGKYLIGGTSSSVELSEREFKSAVQLAQLAGRLEDYKTSDITVDLYVVWIPNTYTIVYNSNGGDGDMDDTIVTYDDFTTSLRDNVFIREGYNFAGWRTTINSEETSFADEQQITTNLTTENEATITLYAQWALVDDYLITYNYDGGTVTEANPIGYNIETLDFTLNNPEKVGYTFDHWELNGIDVGDTVTVEQGSTGPRNYKAVYTPNMDTVYKVEHYQENLEGGYTLVDTDDKIGITGEPAEVQINKYGGFTVTEYVVPNILADGSLVVRMEYARNIHQLTITNDDNVITKWMKYGAEIILETGSKIGYHFVEWQGVPEINPAGKYLMPDDDVEITAIREMNPSSTQSHSGGGGRSSLLNNKHNSADGKLNVEDNKSNHEKNVEADEEDKKNMINETEGQKGNIFQNEEYMTNIEQYNSSYSFEENVAYNFAKSNGITSKSTIKEAKMTGNVTRIAMAKMLSNYAINILGYKPDPTRVKKFVDVTDKLNKEYDDAVTLSYQLGIMGINVPGDRFRPNDIITRAEFATALSRMLYRISDGTGKTKYYRPHIVKLYQEGIISKTNPNLIEKRGYVMVMLMRSAE